MIIQEFASFGLASFLWQHCFLAATRLVRAVREQCRRIRLEVDGDFSRHPGGHTKARLHFVFLRESWA